MISAVDNNIIWGMSGTTSEAYCLQWTTICSAICICDAVFFKALVQAMIIYHLHHATHQLAPTGEPPDVCKGQPLLTKKKSH